MVLGILKRLEIIERLDLSGLLIKEQYQYYKKETERSISTFKRDRRILGLSKYTKTFYQEKFGKKNGNCYFCGKKAQCTHHIDQNRKNNSIINLVELCFSCHRKLHVLLSYDSNGSTAKKEFNPWWPKDAQSK